MENIQNKLQYLYAISTESNLKGNTQKKFIFYYLLREFPVGNGITYIDEWIHRFQTNKEYEYSDTEGKELLDLLVNLFE